MAMLFLKSQSYNDLLNLMLSQLNTIIDLASKQFLKDQSKMEPSEDEPANLGDVDLVCVKTVNQVIVNVMAGKLGPVYKEFIAVCNKKIDKEVTAIIKDIDREME